tara:strand:+ start:117 stop:524 length:408 start_codon:yes stop_codon:yes gene_type:complete
MRELFMSQKNPDAPFIMAGIIIGIVGSVALAWWLISTVLNVVDNFSQPEEKSQAEILRDERYMAENRCVSKFKKEIISSYGYTASNSFRNSPGRSSRKDNGEYLVLVDGTFGDGSYIGFECIVVGNTVYSFDWRK